MGLLGKMAVENRGKTPQGGRRLVYIKLRNTDKCTEAKYHNKKLGIPTCILLLSVLLFIMMVPVYAEENTDTGISETEKENAIILYGEPESYEVQEGDCLWKIADHYLGDGARYTDILMWNEELISDPDLIYPGTTLQIIEEVYVPKLGMSDTGTSMGVYRFDTPAGWTVGVLGDDDIGANFVKFGDGLESMLCLIRDKDAAAEKTVADWEHVKEYICSYAESEYADKVSNLTFEKYYSAEGEEVCFYAYTYTLNFADYGLEEDYTMDFQVCAGIKLTDRISAQFIGYTANESIDDVVHYAAASFEETAAPGESLHVNDSNMSIWPDSTWELDGLYDPFPWIAGYMGNVAQATVDALLTTEEDNQSEQSGRWGKSTNRVDSVLRQKETLNE